MSVSIRTLVVMTVSMMGVLQFPKIHNQTELSDEAVNFFC